MNQVKRNRFFDTLAQGIPNPTTELQFNSTYELLIAVMLSAQATDVSVNLATKPLFKKANTPEQMIKLGEDGVKQYIKSIGLFNSKAANVIATSQILIDQHQGQVPDTREALEKLPGVGRKTANVILNTAFKQPTIAVDTHIFRVSNRTKIAPGKTPLAVELKLLKVVPQQHLIDVHHLLILHGRYTCIARKPKCTECMVEPYCEYANKTPTITG